MYPAVTKLGSSAVLNVGYLYLIPAVAHWISIDMTIYKSPLGELKEPFYGNAASYIMESPHIRQNPDKPVFVDAKDGTTLTGRDSVEYIKRISWILRTQYGIKPDDVVCLFLRNSIYTPVVHQGIMASGGVVSPANVAYMADELAFQIRESRAKLVVASPDLRPVVDQAVKADGIVAERVINLEELIDKADHAPGRDEQPFFLDKETSKTKDAYYCFSSGTSGVPKGVMSSHHNVVSNSQQQLQSGFDFYDPSNVFGAVLPMSHIFGLSKFVFTVFHQASTAVVFEKFDLESMLQNIIKHRITHIHLVPPIIVLLAKSPIVEKYLNIADSLKAIMSGAAPLSDSLIYQAEKRIKAQIYQGYGLTESSPVSHFFAYDKQSYKKASIGWLVAGQEARIVDRETEKDVSYGQPGELWLRGPNIMKGYLRNPTATDEVLTSDGWFKTGDITIMDKSGQFYVVDRAKELIKSKGHQVAPAELEAHMLKHQHVSDCAVTGVYEQEEATELPRAFVVLNDKSADPLKVKEWFDSSVARHKRLWGGIVILDAVPKSPSGKILRRHLRDRKNDKVHGYKPSKL